MGRGRAKAKQAKVARELKYRTPPTDLNALERELAGKSPGQGHNEDQYHDPYDPYDSYDPYEGEDGHRS
ncbi:Protein of unknown function [Haloechinothrix alba]|uniref:DUF3073 domain-containing protein n=2 Tax=Haloechinothrix TaxID=1425377 RepID=A0A238W7N5_9PSEU|nr:MULTISPECIES: DUF3073 domain-containing protein [Haloechinothrix]MBA0124394.1 DUF3073 domain-containing protein [Haloechinothrix aidingensis]SNR42586.1 Protein of unknown function [Haloechinothrix alba]